MMARPFHRISVLARENPFPKDHADHALFAVVRSGQSPVEFLRSTGIVPGESESDAAFTSALRALQRWADYGIVALVPIDPPPTAAPAPIAKPPGLKLARKAANGLGRSVGKAVRHA